MPTIHPLSTVSLHVECFVGGTQLGSGTGFVVTRDDSNYLVTNWHVVTGRDPETGNPLSQAGSDPDTVRIWHHVADKLGSWEAKSEPLRAPENGIQWREHPRGREIDVVALPLTNLEGVKIYPLDLDLAKTDLVVSPSESVSIIGFPLGLTAAGKLPIWKTGHVASDMDINYGGKPIFLIDATTKPGMSGSPVIILAKGMRLTSTGWNLGGEEAVRFLGVYSGRIGDSEIGRVWKPEVLDEILP